MLPEERIRIITERLQTAFAPTYLDVIDDSEHHRGHAGSRDGAGHYTVVITSDFFQQKSRLVIHREIYQILSDLIPKEIHALQIKIKNS